MGLTVINNSLEVKKALLESVVKALNNSVLFVEREAKKNITENGNVDTGHLRANIFSEVNAEKNNLYARVGTDVFYGKYLEFGTGIYAVEGNGRKTPWVYENRKGEKVFTRGSKPHPWLKPAIEDHTEEIKAIFENTIKNDMR